MISVFKNMLFIITCYYFKQKKSCKMAVLLASLKPKVWGGKKNTITIDPSVLPASVFIFIMSCLKKETYSHTLNLFALPNFGHLC